MRHMTEVLPEVRYNRSHFPNAGPSKRNGPSGQQWQTTAYICYSTGTLIKCTVCLACKQVQSGQVRPNTCHGDLNGTHLPRRLHLVRPIATGLQGEATYDVLGPWCGAFKHPAAGVRRSRKVVLPC